MRGAAQIVRARGNDLRNSNAGRRLYHLLSRHELAYYCSYKVLGVSPSEFNRWKNLVYYTESANADDIRDGHLDFEIAWVGLMKIVGALVELRVGLEQADDTPERRTKGEEISEMLDNWKNSLPQQFRPIEMPEKVKALNPWIPVGMDPIFYSTLNIAVAMGKILTFAC